MTQTAYIRHTNIKNNLKQNRKESQQKKFKYNKLYFKTANLNSSKFEELQENEMIKKNFLWMYVDNIVKIAALKWLDLWLR